VVSEIAAMATDLAEFLGGSIGLALLFNMPLLAGWPLRGWSFGESCCSKDAGSVPSS
jgi:Mn2+/Fe2+ NRAMP family transporter